MATTTPTGRANGIVAGSGTESEPFDVVVIGDVGRDTQQAVAHIAKRPRNTWLTSPADEDAALSRVRMPVAGPAGSRTSPIPQADGFSRKANGPGLPGPFVLRS
jgi:hypothetical protein